ncbi:MAG: diguanylate cyclase [Lachnospiraceae bacterium]|nr:diguanylate cyclase [Lachnospiraceae bacterium]
MKSFIKSLKGKVFLMVSLPLIVLAVLMGIVASNSIRTTLEHQIEINMEKQCKYILDRYDSLYPGEFSVERIGDNGVKVYKGTYDITTEYDLLDAMQENFGDDFTIYARGLSVLTTLTDSKGERALLNEISSVVQRDVLDTGESKFYTNVTIQDQSYYAYFEPIIWEDGTVFGMVAVFRPEIMVYASIKEILLPVIVIFVISSLVIIIIALRFATTMVDRILTIQKFITSLAGGRFDTDIPASYFDADDELGELASSGRTMQRSLRLLVEYDALTKINNRRYADNKLKSLAKNSAEAEFCLAIGDIDFFKKFNDTYGHDAGDEVLKSVAAVLKKHMKGYGFVARWGGEEFLFVFDMVGLEKSTQVLWDTLDEIRAMDVKYNKKVLKVTMSFGITESKKGATVDEILKKADENLYTAKETGRNQVIAD